MNFCMELSKTEFIAKGEFYIGNIQNLSLATVTVCVVVDVKVHYKFMTPSDTGLNDHGAPL